MIKHINTFFFALILFCFTFCKKNDVTPSDSFSTAYISAKIDGKEFSASRYDAVVLRGGNGCFGSYNDNFSVGGLFFKSNLTFSGFQNINNDTTNISLSISSTNNITAKKYKLYDGSNLDSSYVTLFLKGFDNASIDSTGGEVNITSLTTDNLNKRKVSGTFFATFKVTLVGKTQRTIKITDGKLNDAPLN